MLGPSWLTIPKDKILLIMDGLDEIEAKNKNTAIRRIEAFCDEYPSIKIIISCRKNFYNIEKEEPGTLGGFSTYILLDIDDKDVARYIENKLGHQAEAFKNTITALNLNVLLRVPFYLVSLVNLFSINKQLPENKAAIFEHLVHDRMKLDSTHFRTTIEIQENRKIISGTLERLALGMEMLGKNYLTTEEFTSLIDNQRVRDLTKYCTVWTKNDSKVTTWQFEHNNFQEYFAAKVLSEKPLDIIKKTIAFKPDYKKVIPSWINTLSFLLNISKDPELYNWILETEPEFAIKLEPTRIEDKIKINIFKDIFTKYKEKQIWIPMEKYDYGELARFGQSDDIPLYLIIQIEEAAHYTTCCNAIQLLSLMSIPFELRDRASKALLRRALEGQSLKILENEQVQSRALIALARLGLNSQENIDKILSKLRDAQNDMIRYGLYYFLRKSEYLDEHIDIFLDGIRYIGLQVTDGSSVSTARVGNELWNLKKGLEQAKNPEAIKRIIVFFIQNSKRIDNTTLTTVLSALAENTALAYCEDPAVLELAINLLSVLVREYRKEEIRQFIRFFDNTGTRLQAFQRIFKKQPRERETMSVLAALADTISIEFVTQEYEGGQINESDIRAFQHLLALYNYDLFLSFNALINKNSGNKFPLPQRRDFEKERKQRIAEDIILLFEKAHFIEQIELIFQKEQKQALTTDYILEIMTDRWDNPYFSDLVIHTLLEISKKEPIALGKVLQMVNSWDWDWFRISKLYGYFNSVEDLTITEEQKAWISQWCYSNLAKVNFKTALITKAGRQFSAGHLSIYLWYFLIKLDLKYSSNILLDMLSFDWVKGHEMFGTKYLENKIPVPMITKRVLENLSDGILNDDILKNHFDFCARYKIKECLPYAIKEISNKDRSYESRREALKAITKTSGTPLELEAVLDTISDDFKWEIVEQLTECKSELTHKFLLTLLAKGSGDEKLKAASYLLIYQDLDGLKYYADWVEGNKRLPEMFPTKSPLEYLENPRAIPLLMELLRISFNEHLREEVPSLYSIVLKVLTAMALKSDAQYALIKNAIEQFMNKNALINGINFLNIFLEELEEKYYVMKSERLSVDEVVNALNMVLSP